MKEGAGVQLVVFSLLRNEFVVATAFDNAAVIRKLQILPSSLNSRFDKNYFVDYWKTS